MIVRKHPTPNGIVLAVCDSELLGKKFSSDEQELDLSCGFYDGDEMTEKEFAVLAKDAYIINIVGKESIGIVSKIHPVKNIIKISGIPHAQILCIKEH